jgi:hypothetical protein
MPAAATTPAESPMRGRAPRPPATAPPPSPPPSPQPPGSSGRVGPDVEADAVLQVASRLLSEGLARLETGPEAALVALRQAFQLERQFGGAEDGERLCRACAGLCRALAKLSSPGPPSEAVGVLLQALDTLEQRKRRAGKEQLSVGELAAHEFLARELLGLARRLGGAAVGGGASTGDGGNGGNGGGNGGGSGSWPSSPKATATLAGAPPSLPPAVLQPLPRLDELRSADRAFERLAQMAASGGPLRLGASGPHGEHELAVTHQELLFQLALTAKSIGSTLLRENTARDTEAATFYFSRAVRKLRLAGVSERDAHMKSLLRLVDEAEAQAERLKNPGVSYDGDLPPAGVGTGGGGVPSDEDGYCAIQ